MLQGALPQYRKNDRFVSSWENSYELGRGVLVLLGGVCVFTYLNAYIWITSNCNKPKNNYVSLSLALAGHMKEGYMQGTSTSVWRTYWTDLGDIPGSLTWKPPATWSSTLYNHTNLAVPFLKGKVIKPIFQ